jgi:signal recognition particle receptor subunit beta
MEKGNYFKLILLAHVDFGKSTICGNLLYKVGYFNEHDRIKAEQDAKGKTERYKWAFLLDNLEEERAKGKTHEYSQFDFKYNNNEFRIIDTPGHSLFVRSTIEALVKNSGNLTGIIVLSSLISEFRSGFDGGIVKEQLILARASGITNIVIVFNKMDLINWDKSKLNDIKNEILEFIKILKFKNTNFCYVCGYTGENVLSILDEVTKQKNQAVHLEGILPKSEPVTIFKCQCKIIKCENIITKGFSCIAYIINDKETENSSGQICDIPIEICGIKENSFAKTGEIVTFKIKTDTELNIYSKQKIILRTETFTLGFGKII